MDKRGLSKVEEFSAVWVVSQNREEEERGNMIHRIFIPIVTCAIFCICLYSDLSAEPQTDPLQIRIEKLEEELNELKRLMRQRQESREEGAKDVNTKQNAETSAEKTVKEAAKTRAVSKFQFEPYGYIKLDASYDDSRTNYGNFVLYVPGESGKKNDDEFNVTARQTRLGMNIMAPNSDDWTARGKIEVDFYGDGSSRHESKAEPMLRHAFFEMSKEGLSIIAGQTSDVISPLNPYTLNYTVGWAGGNIGYRRPQLRMTYEYELDNRNRFLTAVSITRTSGLVNEDLDLDGQNDGEDSGIPSIQARLALATKQFTEKESVFGVSGHYGREEMDWDTIERELESWSINLDFDIPFTDRISLKGEAFVGCNLDDYFGGILQGVNVDAREGIKATGGWAQVRYQPDQEWQVHAGFGLDNPSDKYLDPGMRAKNSFLYFNALYKIIPSSIVGLEYSRWETEYKETSRGTDNRVQASFIYGW
jgi:hypothetical protein